MPELNPYEAPQVTSLAEAAAAPASAREPMVASWIAKLGLAQAALGLVAIFASLLVTILLNHARDPWFLVMTGAGVLYYLCGLAVMGLALRIRAWRTVLHELCYLSLPLFLLWPASM